MGGGWRGSKIGYFYGGQTIQGLLPFYYNIIAPGTAMEVNRCASRAGVGRLLPISFCRCPITAPGILRSPLFCSTRQTKLSPDKCTGNITVSRGVSGRGVFYPRYV